MWHSRLRTWCCHCSSSGCCCASGLILGQGACTCCGRGQKAKSGLVFGSDGAKECWDPSKVGLDDSGKTKGKEPFLVGRPEESGWSPARRGEGGRAGVLGGCVPFLGSGRTPKEPAQMVSDALRPCRDLGSGSGLCPRGSAVGTLARSALQSKSTTGRRGGRPASGRGREASAHVPT